MSKRPNSLGTFLSDMKDARRLFSGPGRWSAAEKAAAHRRFRRVGKQMLRTGAEPPLRINTGYYG